MPEVKRLLKRVKKIEIKTKHLVDGLLQGAYHSIFKGRGIEFSEVREYQIGDDVRSIDWNVTARMNKPYVKEFIEERDLTVLIVFDVSSSNEFGSEKMKKEASIEIAASLMFAALRNNDKVGLVLFTQTAEKFIPPRKGKKHVLRLIREMIYFKPERKGTDLNKTLEFISKIIKKRSIIFIVSDFVTGDFSKALKIMRKKHDVIAISVQDPNELQLPDIGFIELEDEETGEQILVNTSDKEFQQKYQRLIKSQIASLKNKLSKAKADFIQIMTTEPFEVPLRAFFMMRKKRIR